MLLPVLLVLLAPGVEDWPQFRGPNSDGHADQETAPLVWSDTSNIRWKTDIPGLGWSSPVVSSNSVWLTTAVEQDGRLSLRCLRLSRSDGSVIWSKEVRLLKNIPPIHSKNSHASPTPILNGSRLFVHFGTHGTACLNADDGTLLWRNTDIAYPPVHGSGGSPVLAENHLILICDGSSSPFVIALDSATGQIRWKTPRSITGRVNHSFATASLLKSGQRTLVLAPGPDHLAAYDLKSGSEVWHVRADGWSAVPQPVVTADLVIYNHDYDNPELIAVRHGGSGDVTESHIAWRLKRGAPSTPSPLLVDGKLFLVSDTGIASCVNASDGSVYWTKRLGGNFSASPVYADQRVLFLSEDGKATWVKPTTEFHVIAECRVTGRTFATPAFSRGEMLLRTESALLCVRN